MNYTPRRFASELADLKASLVTMGRLVEERLRIAVDALVQRNADSLAEVIAGDSHISKLKMDIDERCLVLIGLNQPVAVDLRTILSVLKISGDLERVGSLAADISEAAQRYLQQAPIKPLIDLPLMGELALKMLREALDAFVSRDVRLAQTVLMEDDWLDALKDQILRELLTHMLGDPERIEPSLDLILISRFLERAGDHATNVAEDVIFIVEARDVRHRSTRQVAVERRKFSGIPPV